MGASQFTTGIQPIPNLAHWEEFTPPKSLHQLKQTNYITYRNKFSGLLIDRYELGFRHDEEQKIYKYQISQRSRDKCIVEVLFYCHETYSQFCRDTQRCYVYIQHMPVRLKNISQVSVQEATYIFWSALQGMGKLYDQNGYFQLKQNHFCFNRQGELKVWMNEDLSKNYPEDVGLNSMQRSQGSMVCKLIQLLTKKLPIKYQVPSFQQYLAARNIKLSSFEHAKKLLKCFTIDQKINAPPRCESLTNKYPRQRSTIKKNVTKTNLSSIKARVMGQASKNQSTETSKKLIKPLPVYNQTLNQSLNYSIEQSRMVNVIWESAHKRPTSMSKPLSSFAALRDTTQRKTTLADALLSQSSVSCSTKSVSRLTLGSLSHQQPWRPISPAPKIQALVGRLKQGNKTKVSTTMSTPRDFIYRDKCKYSTTDIQVEVDPAIVEDLRKYL